MKWVLKNKGEKVRARLIVREIKRVKSEDEKLGPGDVLSAMPQVESLKALVSHVMTERVDKRGRNSVHAVFDVSRHTFTVCVNVMFTWKKPIRIALSWTRGQTQQNDVRDARCEQCVAETVDTSAAMALSRVQANRRYSDQTLLMDSVTESIL